MKRFDQLWEERSEEARSRPAGSGTVAQLDAGVHAIGKNSVEGAAESWTAAEHEGRERTAEEVSRLLHHAQCLMLAAENGVAFFYRAPRPGRPRRRRGVRRPHDAGQDGTARPDSTRQPATAAQVREWCRTAAAITVRPVLDLAP